MPSQSKYTRCVGIIKQFKNNFVNSFGFWKLKRNFVSMHKKIIVDFIGIWYTRRCAKNQVTLLQYSTENVDFLLYKPYSA